MIAQLSKRIASFFVHSRVIESENEQVYEYGLELLISTLLNGVIALVLALFSRTLWQCICFLLSCQNTPGLLLHFSGSARCFYCIDQICTY